MPAEIVRLDERAQELFDNPQHPDRSDKRREVWDAVRDARVVINCRDQIIKHPDIVYGETRAATMADIEASTLVQG